MVTLPALNNLGGSTIVVPTRSNRSNGVVMSAHIQNNNLNGGAIILPPHSFTQNTKIVTLPTQITTKSTVTFLTQNASANDVKSSRKTDGDNGEGNAGDHLVEGQWENFEGSERSEEEVVDDTSHSEVDSGFESVDDIRNSKEVVGGRRSVVKRLRSAVGRFYNLVTF